MSFGSNTHKTCSAILVALLIAAPVFAATENFEVAELDLAQAKDSFNEVWHAAAETTKKRTELQDTLEEFDSKVANAKKELDSASKERKVVRQKIQEKQAFVDIIRAQLNAIIELRGFYQFVADTHRETFVRFVRYVSSKNIARTDAGSVVGGSLLRLFMRGSLGDSIDDSLAMGALLKARKQLGSHVNVLVLESEKTEQRLQAVAKDLDEQLSSLDKEQRSIAQVVDETSAFIDTSWKQKELTEAELKEVAAEAAETSARIGEIQSSLLRINEQLKERKLNNLKDEMKKLEDQMSVLEGKREALLRKDAAMHLLEEAALKAYQEAITQKNTDKKLYKRIEERELLLKNTEETLERGTVTLEGDASETKPITENERAKLSLDIEKYKAQLLLMKDGVPQDEAIAYIDAKYRAQDASSVREDIAKSLSSLQLEIAKLQVSMSGVASNIDAVEKEFELGDLPPLFLWPVRGPITAGYNDSDYVKVFGVAHQAIDIAVSQGSVVHSISDGVVFAVRDGGALGFSYILIGHRNGYASLYGHVSKFLVSKGDVVGIGQAIALSGGIPGTHGAGRMTTGAHVHLEVTKDGEHVDPRSILK